MQWSHVTMLWITLLSSTFEIEKQNSIIITDFTNNFIISHFSDNFITWLVMKRQMYEAGHWSFQTKSLLIQIQQEYKRYTTQVLS